MQDYMGNSLTYDILSIFETDTILSCLILLNKLEAQISLVIRFGFFSATKPFIKFSIIFYPVIISIFKYIYLNTSVEYFYIIRN